MFDEDKRVRVTGYISPESSQALEKVKDQLSDVVLSRVSIGMALDYMIKRYLENERKNEEQ